jgi:hypothetical protein
MTSLATDWPVSALRARLIEDMNVRGFSEKTRNNGGIAGGGLLPLFDGIAGGDRFAVRTPDPGHLLGLISEPRGERDGRRQ